MTLGKPLPHDSAPLHVTGQARYLDDIPLPAGALHLAFGLSTVAHGDIAAIDLSAVRASPGVVLVLSADDLADIVRGIREVLADDGVFVFEVSYLIDIVDNYGGVGTFKNTSR